MKLRTTLLALQACLVAATAFAQPAPNPPGFNAPDGHFPEKSQTQAFGKYLDRNTYLCLPLKKPCTDRDPGYDTKGILVAEGPMVTTSYKRSDGQRIEGLLLQRNYERVIREMGGRLQAVMMGQDEGRGYMKQVHLLDRNGQRQLIMVDTYADSNHLNLTVVTLGDAPKILSAAELQKQIDSQGFATLNVNFDTNKAELRDADRPTLEQVVQLLKSSPGLRLSVDGHTDNVGQAPANKLLSQQRAQAIVDHLVAGGIARDRLLAKGHGMEVPVSDNRSEEGRAKNRRVELVKLPAGASAAPEKPAVAATPTPAPTTSQKPATASAPTTVIDVGPDDLIAYLSAHDRVVILFTSPSPRCGFCVGADKTFSTAIAALPQEGWSYVRTQWPVWNQFPYIATAAGVLGLPDHAVYARGSVIGRVSGRHLDPAVLAEKIGAVQRTAP